MNPIVLYSSLVITKIIGALLRKVANDEEQLDIEGSVMIAIAESREEVLEALRDDIYFRSGVWDLAKAQVVPVSMLRPWRKNTDLVDQVQNSFQAAFIETVLLSMSTAESGSS